MARNPCRTSDPPGAKEVKEVKEVKGSEIFMVWERNGSECDFFLFAGGVFLQVLVFH